MRSLLEKKGFTVETVCDGEAGAEYAEIWTYDFLILDVMVPQL
ncbi:MAG: DNA-binding response regulator, partial [Oscillospiraceae bacterium]|nr:DNA-binding response regulator [Oscillospiraceae bacterium]